MKKRILSLFLAVVIAIQTIPTAQGQGDAVAFVEGGTFVGILNPGNSTAHLPVVIDNSLRYKGTDFAILQSEMRYFIITLTDPNGYVYTNYDAIPPNLGVGGSHTVVAVLEGVPPSPGHIAPPNNMRVVSQGHRGFIVYNPIFGEQPWTYTVTSTAPVTDTFAVTRFERNGIIVDGEGFFVTSASIDLSGRNLTNIGITQFGAMKDLADLDLSNNKITELTSLIGLPKLTELNLSDNPICLEEINAFQQAMPQVNITHNSVICGVCGKYCDICSGCDSFPCNCPCVGCDFCRECGFMYVGNIPSRNNNSWHFKDGVLTYTRLSDNSFTLRDDLNFLKENGTPAFRLADVETVVIQEGANTRNARLRFFEDCIFLTSVTLPQNIEAISMSMFRNCRSLPEITIPRNVKTIDDSAFAGCESLISVTFESQIPPAFGRTVFNRTPALTTIYVPVGSRQLYRAVDILRGYNIVEYCFTCGVGSPCECPCEDCGEFPCGCPCCKFCEELKEDCACIYCEFCEELERYCYCIYCNVCNEHESNCDCPPVFTGNGWSFCSGTKILTITNLTGASNWRIADTFEVSDVVEVVVTDGVISNLGSGVFRGCTNLTTVTFPDHFTALPGNAFQNCTSLTSIVIPSNVEHIWHNAFNGCTSLTEIHFKSAAPPRVEFNSFQNVAPNAVAIVPASWGLEEGELWHGLIVKIKCGNCGECGFCNPPKTDLYISTVNVTEGYIELTNPTDTAISTKGLYLSNNEDDLYMWQMPVVIISPDVPIQIRMYSNNNQGLKRMQTNFDLEDDDMVWLTDAMYNSAISSTPLR
jgi:hypothetical protein